MKQKKKWSDYLWIVSALYLVLGFFNIMFAWIGLLCFFIPLLIAIFGGSKAYCNRYCGRGQLLYLLGKRFKLSKQRNTPRWMKSKWFRYGFLLFFLTMFGTMLYTTYLVFSETRGLRQVVKLFWTFQLPWNFAYHGSTPLWAAQFAFGFYSLMLTSTLLGSITMFLFKPRSWCVYCPMGTMTQCICKVKNSREIKE
ncbi:4Fe-4S binding protein [Velocimicrobium porci]|uniref:4Fe-4S binding protein n=1 Tax=Velocimicrobium porci TaxID=2606634 RepID=A0A6L5XXH5_9FIRM|nr:4Fe-4S binding protein [Velocimicrobium porci]MSS63324.1 4Fe-4S binding protein [Velocimicrobium porci]